jgi:hypothetical protein
MHRYGDSRCHPGIYESVRVFLRVLIRRGGHFRKRTLIFSIEEVAFSSNLVQVQVGLLAVQDDWNDDATS